MSAGWNLRRLASAILLAAVFASSGGFHHHERLSGFSPPEEPGSPDQVVSRSKASHWHPVVRAADDTCLACHGQRFAAVTARAQGPAPATLGLFVSHSAPQAAARSFRFGDPTRGPPSVS